MLGVCWLCGERLAKRRVIIRFVEEGIKWDLGGAELYLVGFSLAGKFAASASFAIAYLYAVELFPTQVR